MAKDAHGQFPGFRRVFPHHFCGVNASIYAGLAVVAKI
jgi:hypothetical protein